MQCWPFLCLFGIFNANLVVFSLYLAITKQKKSINILIKVDKSKGGRSAKVDKKSSMQCQYPNFDKVDSGGGGKTPIY